MSLRYFVGELRRSWPRMVLFMIIFLLSMVVPPLMNNFGKLNYFPEYATEAEKLLNNSSRMLSYVNQYVQIWTFVSMVAALFSGIFVTKILNNKVSADFYHSIPMKREELFITRLSVGFVNYFITFFVIVVTVLLLFITQPLTEGYGVLIFKQIIVNFGYSLLSFAMIYSITVFAGMLCGTSIMHLLTTAYFNFILIATYASVILTFNVFMSSFNATYYYTGSWPAKLIPFVRFLSTDLIEKVELYEIFFYAIGSLLLFMAALALYKFRKIEKAGTPIVFGGFASFLRYSILFPTTLFSGLFFKAIVGSLSWYIIGLLIGAVLCFMLVNTILAKNARRMFNGIKGFGVYVLIMVLFISTIGFDIFKIDEYIPKSENIESVKISLGNQITNIEFESEEVIKATIALDSSSGDVWKNDVERGSVYELDAKYDTYYDIYVETKDYDYSVFDTGYDNIYYLEVVYKTKYGIPIARRVNVLRSSAVMDAFAEAVANSEDYKEYYNVQLSDEYYSDYSLSFDIITENKNIIENRDFWGKSAIECLEKMSDFSEEINYSYFQRQQIGAVHIYGYNDEVYRNFFYPVLIGDPASEVFIKETLREEDYDDYYDYLASNIEYLAIIKGNVNLFNEFDEDVLLISDKALVAEVLKNASNLTGRSNIFIKEEPLYHIGICYKNTYDYKAGVLCKTTTRFLFGRVPDFVAESFK